MTSLATGTAEPQRVLVAGASGVVGRRLLPALLAEGHRVFGLARSAGAAERVAALGAIPVLGDVLDRDAVFAAVRGTRASVVVHQATALGRGLEATNAVRTAGTRNLVAAAERHGVQRLVAQSIAFAYRHEGPDVLGEDAPLDVGAPGAWGDAVRAVAALEDAVMDARQVQGVVLRYGRLYGPDTALSPCGAVGRQLAARRLPVIGEGRGRTSFVSLDDAAGAALAAVGRGWGVFNVVDDVPAPAAEWVPALARALGAPEPRRVPEWMARETEDPRLVAEMTTQRGASNALARTALGWRPATPDWREGFLGLARPAPACVESARGGAQRVDRRP